MRVYRRWTDSGHGRADSQGCRLRGRSEGYPARARFRLLRQGHLQVSEFLPYLDFSLDVADYEAVVAAVRRGAGDDVDAVLYGRNKEYAPFFCAECGFSYCATH